VRGQKIETIRESTDNNLNLQIYHQNKYSSHSTNNVNKQQLERFISEAVASTTYLSPDPDRALPDPALYPAEPRTDLGLTDPAYANITPEFRVERAMETEQLVRQAYPEVISTSGRFNDTSAEVATLHTNGFEGEIMATYFGTSASATIMDGNSRPAGSTWAGSRFLNELPQPAKLAQDTIYDILRQIGQAKIASGKYNMILENRIAGNLLFRLFQPMQARSIQQKNSFLADMMGKSIASDKLTVIDDPFIRGGLASRYFDGDGIALKKRVMIENGVLKEFYIDNYYGRKLGMTPNGGSSTNILLGYGSRDAEAIIADQDKAILVTSFNGGNANSTTGDFSFGISGQLIENGKVVRAVNEMNISGNFLELFQRLMETGNDPYQYSSAKTPTMLFADVDFSGL
jgi:PmbA protein